MNYPQKVFPPANVGLVYRVTKILSEARSWQDGLNDALIPIRDHFVFDNAAVYLISEETSDPIISFARAAGRGRNSEADASWGLSIVDEIIEKQKIVLINHVDPTETDRLKQPLKLGLPLIHQGTVIGALVFIRFGTPPYLQDQIDFARGFADFLALVIHNHLISQSNAKMRLSLETVRVQEDFISMLSHEIRTPLGFIKGYTSTLLREDVEWDEATKHEFLKIVDKETDNLQTFLTNLIESSRLQSGRISLKYEEIEISEYFDQVIESLQKRSPETQIIISKDIAAASATLDKTRIRQVIENLITNAIKYAPNTPISVTVTSDDEVLRFKITDKGPGIPEKYQAKLFDRFFRVPSNKPSQHGSGMGLYICKQIINAHQGEILLQSMPGEGTSFTVTIPRRVASLDQRFGMLP